uniref:DnaJ homolog subfamily C member 30, mitochondrial n=1 Tax=Tetraodon nigroviridis TaxID=99883 RepID=H3DIV8_TETNG
SKTGYYDILEVAPSATQAQIKTAYYKQSFLYHPDRNAGSETATGRFSEISEAYTVLGNKTLRKKYDRGLLSLSDLVGAGCPPGKSVMGADGREKIYNFDAFFKSHYQEQLRREKEIRIRRDEFLKHQTETFEEKKLDWLVEMGIGLMVTLAAVLWISMKA